VEDVNETRVARFHDAITEALGSDQVGFYRDLVSGYERAHDVPAEDVAAALAVLAQDGRPLLMEPEPPSAPRPADERPRRRDDRPRRQRSTAPLASYRIAVGRRQRVEPRQIVGAIANEGGLDRSDFGSIDIRTDHSIVELPAALSERTVAALQRTRISGKLIELTPVAARDRPARSRSAAPGPEPRAKPRTKPRSSKARDA
jgi:ATP-dependent RNA helicase DeaD